MLEAGEDPRFVLRRMVIFAAEDVGNADPQALVVATAALEAVELVGMPEGVLPMTQAVTYLALAPKSNRALTAYAAARKLVSEHGALPVPAKLRPGSNARRSRTAMAKATSTRTTSKATTSPRTICPTSSSGRGSTSHRTRDSKPSSQSVAKTSTASAAAERHYQGMFRSWWRGPELRPDVVEQLEHLAFDRLRIFLPVIIAGILIGLVLSSPAGLSVPPLMAALNVSVASVGVLLFFLLRAHKIRIASRMRLEHSSGSSRRSTRYRRTRSRTSPHSCCR